MATLLEELELKCLYTLTPNYKENKMENKHYIRIDNQNRIIHGFSDAFEQPQADDILLNENGGRQFEMLVDGEWLTNPQLLNEWQVSLYKWNGKKVLKRTEQEVGDDTPEPPEPLPDYNAMWQGFFNTLSSR